MLINGTATLRCKNFLRYRTDLSLELYGYHRIPDAQEDGVFAEHVAYLLHSMEMVVVDTLAVWCDRDTNMHAHRLLNLAEAVGIQLHLSRSDLKILRLAALLHDIGKVAIPPAILQKQGPLDPHEWALIRLHPEIGWNILQGGGTILEHVASLVIAHHEAWDGSGYPRGLRKTEIPFLARILAVVDSYDAMVSARVYGRPLPTISACHELVRCAGRQYDPQVVNAFLHVLLGKKTVPQHAWFLFKRNPAISVPVQVDEEYVKLLLRSAGSVHGSV